MRLMGSGVLCHGAALGFDVDERTCRVGHVVRLV